MAHRKTDDKAAVPWYESNLFWGPFALGVGILLAVVAGMKHDLRWLLYFAALCFIFAAWALSKRWLRGTILIVCVVLSTLVICGGLLAINKWLGEPDPALVSNASSSAPVTPISKTVPNSTTTDTTTQTTPQENHGTVDSAQAIPKHHGTSDQAKAQVTVKPKAVQTPTPQQPPAQDNSVHVDQSSTIQQQSSGPCSPNIVGGANTVNCGPPPPPPLKLQWSVLNTSDTEKVVTVTTNETFTPVAVAVRCDFPPENVTFSNHKGMAAFNVHTGIEGNIAWIYFEGTGLTTNDELYVTVHSSKPFTVLDVQPARIKGLNY